jgi:ribosome-binding protein aMBF1 (putative translation factor)
MGAVDRSERQRIGRMIKTARFERGMTQADLGDKLHMAVSSVSHYERGERIRFSRVVAKAFEEALEITDRRLLNIHLAL